jgi:hypothetical protein
MKRHVIHIGSREAESVWYLSCGLEDQGVGIRFQAGARDISLLHNVGTGCEAQEASCIMGTRGYFSEG